MAIRSTTPLKFASDPIGVCTMIGFGSKHSTASLKARIKSARSLSSLLMNMIHGKLNSSAKCQACSVCTFTPSTASITITTLSAACMQLFVSEKKFWSPGVSMMLISCFFQTNWWNPLLRLIFRLSSSGSKSITVLPSSTRPSLLMTPALNNIASAREVFPAPPWDARAMFLKLSIVSVI